jgi:hypothetical protein
VIVQQLGCVSSENKFIFAIDTTQQIGCSALSNATEEKKTNDPPAASPDPFQRIQSTNMYSLNTIRQINASAASRPRETETTRLCSFIEQRDGSVILHSAKQRSTGWLSPKQAKAFHLEWRSTNSTDKRNQIIESYFASVPVGKQKITYAKA